MKRTTIAIAAGSAAAATAALLWRRRRMSPQTPRDEQTRWRSVTVLGSLEPLPEPLARLGDAIEVRMTPAPGDRGTELSARLASDETGYSPDDVRMALRRSKQLVEAGEIAVVKPQAHGHRKTTPQGIALDAIAAISEGKGVL